MTPEERKLILQIAASLADVLLLLARGESPHETPTPAATMVEGEEAPPIPRGVCTTLGTIQDLIHAAVHYELCIEVQMREEDGTTILEPTHHDPDRWKFRAINHADGIEHEYRCADVGRAQVIPDTKNP